METTDRRCPNNPLGHAPHDYETGCPGCVAAHRRMVEKHIGPSFRDAVSALAGGDGSIPESMYADKPFAVRTPRRRVVSDQLVAVFMPEARRWIDEHIGVNVDEAVTDTEVRALARAFATHFVDGANTQASPSSRTDGGEG